MFKIMATFKSHILTGRASKFVPIVRAEGLIDDIAGRSVLSAIA